MSKAARFGYWLGRSPLRFFYPGYWREFWRGYREARDASKKSDDAP